MPHHNRSWCKKQAQHFKRIIRRQRDSEKRVEARREKLSQVVGGHLAEGGENPWLTLDQVLKKITKDYTFEALFKREQRDPLNFKKDEARLDKRLDRDAVGPSQGKYHLAFFAFAPHFEGKPHSHAINCVSAVLQGPLQEKLYRENGQGRLNVIQDQCRARGSVVGDLSKSNEPQFIHSVSNPSSSDSKPTPIAYSVHVYGACRGTLFNRFYDPSLVDGSQVKAAQRKFKHS